MFHPFFQFSKSRPKNPPTDFMTLNKSNLNFAEEKNLSSNFSKSMLDNPNEKMHQSRYLIKNKIITKYEPTNPIKNLLKIENKVSKKCFPTAKASYSPSIVLDMDKIMRFPNCINEPTPILYMDTL